MGYFNNIHLVNYRNFKNFSLSFSSRCNVFYGKNGSGKTNILEAISLFSKGRGIRKDKFLNIIKNDCEKFIIKSNFKNEEIIYKLIVESENANNRIKKILSVNDDKSKETLKIIYELNPFLYFIPETERLFLSSPSTRRNFIDQLIFTYKNSYNQLINEYSKFIQERSKILCSPSYDETWLNHLEKKISKNGLKIYSLREEQIKSLVKYLNKCLSEFNLPFKIDVNLIDKFYVKDLTHEIYEKNLIKNRKIDSLLGGCNIGPHKSDYLFNFNDDYLVSQMSTGQQKTIILLTYLAHCNYLYNEKNKKPILLLDEICSHLDEFNRNILLTLVESFNLQVFMTGTTKNLFSFLSTNTNFCNITNK